MIGEAKKIWNVVALVACILCFIMAICVALGGCDSQAQKATATADQALKLSQKNDTAIKGNQNSILNNTKTFTSFKTNITETQDQNQKNMRAEFKSFKGTYKSKVDNTKNSSWLMFGIVASILLVGGLVILAILYLALRAKTKRVIHSATNNLTPKLWKEG